MELTEALSEKDIHWIREYVSTYAYATPARIETLLSEWNKNKRTLYRALGKQLRVKIPITIERNTIMYDNELRTIYAPIVSYWSINDFMERSSDFKAHIYNDFVYSVLEYAKGILTFDEFHVFARLFSYSNIEKGICNNVEDSFEFTTLKMKITSSMKIMRAIQKIIKAMNYPQMDLFEQWRNKISDLNANRSFTANLVVSIHPIDFMTMSDNACNWSSCMSWTRDGCYSATGIEMLNSNVAFITYLESDTPYEVCGDIIPNKSWRMLVYAHKDILLSGKQYPYTHHDLAKKILEEVNKLVKKNLNWDYQYGVQEYKDLQQFYTNKQLRGLDRHNARKHHNIIVYTKTMYNDLIHDTDFKYWCYRNYVEKSLYLCASGHATCMCCGGLLFEDEHGTDEDHGCNKICSRCIKEYRCNICDKTVHPDNEETVLYPVSKVNASHRRGHICHECLMNHVYFPDFGYFVSQLCSSTCIIPGAIESEFLVDENQMYFYDSKDIQNYIYKKYKILCPIIPKSFIPTDWYDRGSWITDTELFHRMPQLKNLDLTAVTCNRIPAREVNLNEISYPLQVTQFF